MTVRRWDPWSEMLTLREAMGRLLEDSYVRPGTGGGFAGAESMAMDVYEDADNFEVSAPLPGLKPEDVEITLQGDVLSIKGQRKASAEKKQGNYLMREQRTGTYFRSVQLPAQVDADKVQANFEHGILHLTLPKAASTKPRTIRIGGGQAPSQLSNGSQNGQGREASAQPAGPSEQNAPQK